MLNNEETKLLSSMATKAVTLSPDPSDLIIRGFVKLVQSPLAATPIGRTLLSAGGSDLAAQGVAYAAKGWMAAQGFDTKVAGGLISKILTALGDEPKGDFVNDMASLARHANQLSQTPAKVEKVPQLDKCPTCGLIWLDEEPLMPGLNEDLHLCPACKTTFTSPQ